MTVHPFPPMGQPRNHAEEIANARHDLRQEDAILAILNCDRDDPGLGSKAHMFEPLHDDPEPVSLREWVADAAGVMLLFVMVYGVLLIGTTVAP